MTGAIKKITCCKRFQVRTEPDQGRNFKLSA
jgi:hypothetical protein